MKTASACRAVNDPPVFRIEYDGPFIPEATDKTKGKCRFPLFWTGWRVDLNREGPRAQCFFADPIAYGFSCP